MRVMRMGGGHKNHFSIFKKNISIIIIAPKNKLKKKSTNFIFSAFAKVKSIGGIKHKTIFKVPANTYSRFSLCIAIFSIRINNMINPTTRAKKRVIKNQINRLNELPNSLLLLAENIRIRPAQDVIMMERNY